MFKIYKQTIHAGTTANPHRLQYQVENKSSSGISKLLAIPAMIVRTIAGIIAFSMFFAVLLIPFGILGFRAWRLMRTAPQQTHRHAEAESITAEYTVISDKEKR